MQMKGLLFPFLFFAVLLFTCIIIHQQNRVTPAELQAEEISEKLREVYHNIDREAEQLLKNPTDEEAWQSSRFSFYLVDGLQIIRWNQNGFIPDTRLIRSIQGTQYLQLNRGNFIVKSWPLDSSKLLLSVLSLSEQYKITNRYLAPHWNRNVFGNTHPDLSDPSSPNGIPVRLEKRILFKINIVPEVNRPELSELVFWLGGAAMLSLLVFLFILVRNIRVAKKPVLAFLVLLSGLLAVRWLMVAFNYPGSYSGLPIFDPLRFASSVVNSSIGDFILNSAFALIASGYLFFNIIQFKKLIKGRKAHLISFLGSVIAFLFAFFSLVLPFLFIETIYHNSSISLDLTGSIEFDAVRFLAFLCVTMGCFAGFLLCHSFFRLGMHYLPRKSPFFPLAILAAAFLLFVYYTLAGRNYSISLIIGLFYFPLLHYTRIYKSVHRFSFVTFLYFFSFVTVMSVQTALSVLALEGEDSRESKLRFANTFLVGRDVLGEYLLRESALQISKDQFLKMGFSSPFISKNSMKQKIKASFINSYFDRYYVQVELFSASGKSLDGDSDLTALLKNSEKEAETQYAGIYFVKGREPYSGKQYLVVVPVEQTGLPAGFVVLKLDLKKVIPQNVYPELLVDNRFASFFGNNEYSYAFYTRDKITGSFGRFNYETQFPKDALGNVRLYAKGLVAAGFSHIGVEDEENRVVVVSSPQYSPFSVIANFALCFIAGLGVIFLTLIFLGMVSWNRGTQLTYATRIQIFVYVGFLLPLAAVSTTTIGVIGRSAREQLNREFQERARAMADQLSNDLTVNANPERLYDFDAQLIYQARLADLDAAVYRPSGHLLASSQPSIFQDQLLPDLINRDAWRQIVANREETLITEESIGKLNFSNVYVALKSPTTGQLTGILSVPFFDSENSLERQQINVLANIAIIFVLIFSLFMLISFFAIKWLTFPLRWITSSLSKTTLSGQNSPLQWHANDEIGLMVNEYNRMVNNLERSKVELARSQKESAWREIAKQIAHEIKNPLTPMRLTLQRVEKFIKTGKLSNEIAEQSVQTLLNQVEILNDIASSFSTFARMPAPILQRMDVVTLLKKVSDLHGSYPLTEIEFNETGSIIIMGDEQLLNRVFSNIVLNAIQSADEGVRIKIRIQASANSNSCLVEIRDNGKGIDEQVREKVFLPHFSTKKSGSGLGLAIAKQGVEQSGGAIWFETHPGAGTTFFVKLPLAK